MINKKNIFLTIVVTIIIVFLVIKCFSIYKEDNKNKISFNEFLTDDNYYNDNISNNVYTYTEKIKIHITGEVSNPGLIELDVGSRIYDAIQLAGGITDLADTSKTNLAYVLSDGEKVYIPSINDEDNIKYIDFQNTKEKININTANASELNTIPGVGESTAISIIEYRNSNRKI